MRSSSRAAVLFTALVFAASLGAATPSIAADTGNPSPPQPQPSSGQKQPGADKSKKRAPKKQQKKTEQEFYDGYKAAHAMIYQGGDYAGGIAKLKSLDQDDHPDVANLIGFSSRKLGRYDDARHWYEKALAANPNHSLTWSYYGMWHAEQGNLLKARDHLDKVASICGTQCREYVMLKDVIEGTRAY
jgi:tetratricopeptide (TPR) repeat protein